MNNGRKKDMPKGCKELLCWVELSATKMIPVYLARGRGRIRGRDGNMYSALVRAGSNGRIEDILISGATIPSWSVITRARDEARRLDKPEAMLSREASEFAADAEAFWRKVMGRKPRRKLGR